MQRNVERADNHHLDRQHPNACGDRDFVVNPTEDFIKKFMGDDKLNSRGKDHNGRLFPKRHPEPINELLTRARGREAGLTKAEAIGIRLYTGSSHPLSVSCSLSLSFLSFSLRPSHCLPCTMLKFCSL